jgi:probable selenium-dependent hydroxylase accessory protein YqeC
VAPDVRRTVNSVRRPHTSDGARRRGFKAPGPAEPALPEATTLVVPVASVRVVGEPLDETAVHRVERVSQLTGLAPGDELTTRAVGTVLASPEAGLKGVPAAASVAVLVNQADTDALAATAREVLAHAFEASGRPVRGVVASFRADRCEVVAPADLA